MAPRTKLFSSVDIDRAIYQDVSDVLTVAHFGKWVPVGAFQFRNVVLQERSTKCFYVYVQMTAGEQVANVLRSSVSERLVLTEVVYVNDTHGWVEVNSVKYDQLRKEGIL